MRNAITLFVALLGLALSPLASAQSMHNEQALIDGATLSESYSADTFWFDTPDGIASGVRLNDWYGLISAHQIYEGSTPLPLASELTVGTGSNYLTDPGTIIGVSEYLVHPGYIGVVGGTSVDLAIVRFDQAWEGDDVSIGSVDIGDLLTYVGFGLPATPSLGILPADGQRRAFQTYVNEFGTSGGGFSSDYISGRFDFQGLPGFLPLGGIATPGNSGGGVWNGSGELVGIVSAAPASPNHLASTFSYSVSTQQSWIEANTVVPEPGSGALLLLGIAAALRRNRARPSNLPASARIL